MEFINNIFMITVKGYAKRSMSKREAEQVYILKASVDTVFCGTQCVGDNMLDLLYFEHLSCRCWSLLEPFKMYDELAESNQIEKHRQGQLS